MNTGSRRYIKNALSNLMTGGASALLAISLPHYFVKDFTSAEFSLWVLVLQLAAYVNFLNFGVQTAVGRYVAHALARDEQREAENIVSAAIQILCILGGFGACIVAIIAWQLPAVFHKIDPSMIGTARYMLFWIGGALVINLPATAFFGVFVGRQRNDIPAVIAAISKGSLALSLVLVAGKTHNLRIAAQTYFVVSTCGTALQYIAFKWLCGGWHLRIFARLSAASRELTSYCASLTMWSVGMLLVSGLDTTIVGIFDFKNVAAYGSSVSIVAFFVGTFSSLTNPLLQVFSKIHAKGDAHNLTSLFVRASRLTSLLLFGICWWMILPVNDAFRIWIGQDLARQAAPIFCVLIVANAIRSTSSPFAYYLLSAGLQRKVYLSPFVEGVTNLFVSIAAAWKFGAIGVAWGTAVGAICGVAANYLYNFRTTLPKSFSRRSYFMSNLGMPILQTLPMITVLLWFAYRRTTLLIEIPVMLLASLPGLISIWRTYRVIAGNVGTVHAA